MNVKRTALITGATSGIGAAYASWLAKDGYDLILTGRRAEKINALAAELSQSYGSDVDVNLIELSDSTQVDGFLDRIKDRDIHLLINNAGFGTVKFFFQEPLELQEQMVRAHILAHMKIIYAILPKMIQKGVGVVINVASSGAYLPSPKTATYSGTKAFWRAFTECLHLELEGTGIQVQVVCPGLTRTDMHSRLGIPDEYTPDWGPFHWMVPDEVVECSLRCLKKKRIVCIPGRLTRMQIFMRQITPESLYYKGISYFFRKYGWTDGKPSY